MRIRLEFWPTVVALPVLALLIGLGTWQVQRLEWKTALIEAIEERAQLPPAPLPASAEWETLDLAAQEFRRFTARGVFDHRREFHVFTQYPDDGTAGYWILTPLELAQGGTVLVNRGFVPQQLKPDAGNSIGETAGEIEITGVLRRSGEANIFTPDATPGNNMWFIVDVPSMAGLLDNADVAPFYLALTEPAPAGGLPRPAPARIQLNNRHLGYALTWFGLAACLVGVFVAWHLRREP